MSKTRIVLYIIFGLYQLVILIFTLYIGSSKVSFNFLYDLLKYLSWFKFGALIGLLLLMVDFAWVLIDMRKFRQNHETLRHENNTLKAKVYDLQQSPKQPVKETPSSGAK